MSITVLVAVLAAAFLHAAWNALLKQSADKKVAMTSVVAGHIPFAALALLFFPPPSFDSLPYLVLGIALHIGYQLFLLQAYKIGDLSHVYPISRGTAPLIVAATSMLALGVTFTWSQSWGIFILSCGILSLALVRQDQAGSAFRVTLVSLGTAVFIAAYTLVDGLGARISGSAMGFYAWLAIGNGVCILLFSSLTTPVQLVPRISPRSFLAGGGASFGAYAIVMWAFTQAPIALVAAVRETSIIFGLIFAAVILKERLKIRQILSVMTTLVGVVLVKASR